MAASDVRDLAAKLRLTAAFLGCSSHKELAASFRRINSSTEFDLERSYKWMQGRALPRSRKMFEDWAVLLGGACEARWVATCDACAFVDVLCSGDAAERTRLLGQAGLDSGGAGNGDRAGIPANRTGSGNGYLCGVYACYSHAQSPYYSGQLIRGALVIEPATRHARGLVATYSEALSTGRALVTGAVQLSGRALFLNLHTPSDAFTAMFFSLFPPAPPASVVAGIMTGATVTHPGSQPPYASRIVMVRVPCDLAALEVSNRYMDLADETPAGDLAGLGLPVAERTLLDAQFDQLLRPAHAPCGSDQVAAGDYTLLAAACDRLWLAVIAGAGR